MCLLSDCFRLSSLAGSIMCTHCVPTVQLFQTFKSGWSYHSEFYESCSYIQPVSTIEASMHKCLKDGKFSTFAERLFLFSCDTDITMGVMNMEHACYDTLKSLE